MRSPILTASSMSWLTNMIVLPSASCILRNSSWMISRLIGSIAPKGSSISMTGGSAGERARHADALRLAAGQLLGGSA